MKGTPERIWLTPNTNIAAPGKHATEQVAYRREDLAMYYRDEFYRIEKVLERVRGMAEAELDVLIAEGETPDAQHMAHRIASHIDQSIADAAARKP